MDLYETLELNSSASLDDIKKSYRRLAKLYHPDKNNNDQSYVLKFHKVTSAYEILSNEKLRKEYLSFNSENKINFETFLEKILNNTIDFKNISKFGIKINKADYDYLKTNCLDFLNKLNLYEIIDFFKTGDFPKKDLNFNNNCSDSDVESYNSDDASYFDSLPITFQKPNNLTLKIIEDITINDIIYNKVKQLSIKRKIYDTYYTTKFEFSVKSPLVLFSGGGDIDNSIGDLIIKLKLPVNYEWDSNLIIYNKEITLYEYVHGLDINIEINRKKYIYTNWKSIREGTIIHLDKVGEINFIIKLNVKYNESPQNNIILKEYFN